jgi:GntR family colanic acid and biofilm gene transcriptional regulator
LRLVSAGALHATPAQAFLVPEVTLERYNEINAIRKQLEPWRSPQPVRICLSKSWRRCANCRTPFMRPCGNVQQALHANRVFRFTLYQYAEMPTLNALIEQLWVRIGPCINYLHQELNDIKVSTYHYDELLSALERRDVDASQKAIDKLIDEANLLLQRQYFN